MSLGRRQGAIEQHVAFVRSTTPNGRVLREYIWLENEPGTDTHALILWILQTDAARNLFGRPVGA